MVAPARVRHCLAAGDPARRPPLPAVPAFAARLLLGELAEEVVLAGAPWFRARLLASGYPPVRDARGRFRPSWLENTIDGPTEDLLCW
jgi:hypothetical protein